jgi:hypothetical protein
MKFEELSEQRQQQILNELRETSADYDWWKDSLVDLCIDIKENVGIEICDKELSFDFFSKGRSGLWITDGGLQTALRQKYTQLEELNISDDFGVWAYIGLRKDEVEIEDIELWERDEEREDLTALFEDKQDEQDKEKIKEDIERVLDIFYKGYNSLYEEYSYLTSDEGIIETIKDYEMEFEDED